MATNSSIAVTEGSGKNIASHSITESTTKELQRIELNNSSGTEIGTSTNPLVIGGDTASGSTDANNPIKIGAVAKSSEPTAVSTGQRVNLFTDLVGKLIVLPFSNPENFVSGVTSAMTGTTSTSLISAPSAGLRNYITQIIVTNSHASVGTFVLIQDGNAGTTIYEGYAAAAGGGFSISFPVPLRQPTTATALYVQNVTTGANTIASASGYKGA